MPVGTGRIGGSGLLTPDRHPVAAHGAALGPFGFNRLRQGMVAVMLAAIVLSPGAGTGSKPAIWRGWRCRALSASFWAIRGFTSR